MVFTFDSRYVKFNCILFSTQLLEPILLLGKERFAGVDIRIRVKGGGQIAQVYGKIFHTHVIDKHHCGK